jgi:hypothetical protein
MPIRPFRQKLKTIDALQYSGYNNLEMIGFAGEHVTEKDGALYFIERGHLRPLAPTSWVFTDAFGNWNYADDTIFNAQWESGL